MAAGTADGDGHVTAFAGGVAGQPFLQVVTDVLVHIFHFRLFAEVITDRGITAGKGAQVGQPVRVGQATHVEYQVGIHRQAAFEPE